MGVNTVKQTLTVALATGGTLVLDERLDVFRHADAAAHVLVLKNATARYVAPTDFTVAVDGRGKATVTWLNAVTLPVGAELNFGFWQYDNTANGTQTGGSGGGGDTSLLAKELTLQELVDIVGATGTVIIAAEPCSYQYVGANSTDTAVGNANDQLVSILLVPTSLSPGEVSIEDGTGTNRVLFAGGASSIVTKHSWAIDLQSIAAGSVWEVTVGADINAWVFYRPRA